MYTNNIAARAYVNRQGGTRSAALQMEARRLMLWVEKNLSSMRAEHTAVDWLSCQDLDHSE